MSKEFGGPPLRTHLLNVYSAALICVDQHGLNARSHRRQLFSMCFVLKVQVHCIKNAACLHFYAIHKSECQHTSLSMHFMCFMHVVNKPSPSLHCPQFPPWSSTGVPLQDRVPFWPFSVSPACYLHAPFRGTASRRLGSQYYRTDWQSHIITWVTLSPRIMHIPTTARKKAEVLVTSSYHQED